MERWRGIEEFMAVVEAGSFSKAADKLGTTVSQISKRVAGLEKSLNVRLLERTTRTINLTLQGNLFYQACRKLLNDLQHASDSIQMDKEALTGQLRLCSVGGSRPAFQMDLYRSFLEKYPGLNMDVVYSDHIPSLSREGLDLALVVGEIDSTRTETVFHLCWIDYVLVAAPALLETCALPTEPADLSALPCILNGEDHWRLSNGSTSVQVPVSGRFSSLNMPACIDACLSGHGVFMAPAYAVDTMVNSGRLVQVLPGWHIRKSMYAMIPDDQYVPTKVILLIEFMEEAMGKDPDEAGKLRRMLLKTSSKPMELLRSLNEGIQQADINTKRNRSK